MSASYDPKAVEARWQDRWEKQRVAEADLRHAAGKYYLLTKFPSPSEDRLHVGPRRNYILADALFRYLRMHGKRLLNPMGWDAFGLPAEDAALQRGVHPRDWALGNAKAMKEQLRRWGILFDWTREITSCTPEHYRWSQWLFLRMLEKGMAYREKERWFLRITAYADRLLEGLDRLPEWPEHVKTMQRNEITGGLRDWRVSRPRYWGTPIPIVHCDKHGTVPVPDDQLPVELPYDVDLTGEGNPLARHRGFVETKCPRCGKPARRETDTLDTLVDSSWSFLRCLSPRDGQRMFDPELANRWLPVDQYISGAEHATRHLLYARFICRVLYDLGMVGFEEPFTRLFSPRAISRPPDGPIEEMGAPGADIERVYTLFLGPPEKEAEWNDEAVAGVWRFLNRVWRLGERLSETPYTAPADAALERERHAAIQRVTQGAQRFHFNTAVAALMELSSALARAIDEQTASRLVCEETFDTLLQLLHPMAPHITEELWERRGYVETLLETDWPEYDEKKLQRARISLVVQVDGKLRDRVEVDAGAGEREARAAALDSAKVQEHLAGREVVKAVLVPGRLINLVTRRSA
ncbi:MAG TPA: class I tRNA ligase family protein [Thermoanaerobaculia bacterium]|nr:class I tRNA ligase family protein [Thermoanaerobaculia bacterium]